MNETARQPTPTTNDISSTVATSCTDEPSGVLLSLSRKHNRNVYAGIYPRNVEIVQYEIQQPTDCDSAKHARFPINVNVF
jgi:hypothetical protein